jgi:hypothetical protein
MSDELWEGRRSVAFPLLSLALLCLPLPFFCLPSQLGFLLSFLLCLEEKCLVVWGAVPTHLYMNKGRDRWGNPMAVLLVRLPVFECQLGVAR